jgi:glycosyltransferase involved in cell wall biosynthesis
MKPFVSVVIPIRNEENFIQDCLKSVLHQDYPRDKVEIIIIDGMSNDRTLSIVQDFSGRNKQIIVLTNPDKIVSSSLNMGIKRAKGEVIVRVDGHTILDSGFISENIRLLDEHPEAWAVGGGIAHRGRNNFAKGVAIAMSSLIGVGNASHRKEDCEGYAEGVAFPAFRADVFHKVGMFDETLVRNQDDEFNFRIIESGGKIYASPKIKHIYYVRDVPMDLWLQYFQYGFWKMIVAKKHKRVISLRHLVPALFVLYNFLIVLTVFVEPSYLILASTPLLIYLLIVFTTMIYSLLNRNGLLVSIYLGISVIIMHISYGCGSIFGLLRDVSKGVVSNSVTKLSR